jgi:hypothetical protein
VCCVYIFCSDSKSKDEKVACIAIERESENTNATSNGKKGRNGSHLVKEEGGNDKKKLRM